VGTFVTITAADLRTALTPRTYIELYCTDPINETIDADAVAQDIEIAEGQVDSHLLGFYAPLPEIVDRVARAAGLMYAKALAYMRNPEYVRTYGEVAKVKLWQDAQAMMERVQAVKQRLPDASPSKGPANNGGIVPCIGPNLMLTSTGDF
jgi:hypothetical protein